MRILFVAMSESLHTARWISQIAEEGWELHLFPSIDHDVVHPQVKNVAIHNSTYGGRVKLTSDEVLENEPPTPQHRLSFSLFASHKAHPKRTQDQVTRLIYVIDHIKPDIIHSLEFQHAGYLTLAAREIIEQRQPGSFPVWMVTNWGSDIYLFGRMKEHQDRIRSILQHCDYYLCECHRDVELAKEYGLKGKVLPVYPNAGGLDLAKLGSLRQPGPVSQRRTVTLKGYQHFAGRALIGLQAIEMCADELRGYQVAIYSPFDDVRAAAEEIAASTGIEIELIPGQRSHSYMLELFGRSRVYVGLSISDAISNSMLEAIAMGAFPIQSNTSCADEWIRDRETGFLVPPEDPLKVADALRQALTDDQLVDRAAERNSHVCAERLNGTKITSQVIALYRQVGRENQIIRVLQFPDRPRQNAPTLDLPVVSVLTPTYNRAKFLRETINSVLNQTYPNIEYVVLDDGSTDNTIAILKEYEDQLRWESHPNMGETRTVNKGLRMLAGKYVMVVNSDDPILPDLVEKTVAYMESNPDLLMVYPDWYVINERSEVINSIQAWDYDYHEMIRVSGCIPGPGALIRADAVNLERGRNEKYRYVGDFEFWLRLGRHGPFQRIPEYLATHRHHSSSAGVSEGEALSSELIRLMKSFFEQPGLPGSIRRLKWASLSAAYYDAALRCQMNPVLTRRYALRAFAYRPRVRTRTDERRYSRHPNLYSTLTLMWPESVNRIAGFPGRIQNALWYHVYLRSSYFLRFRVWGYLRHRIYPFFRFRVWGFFRHRIYPFFRFRAWGFFRHRIYPFFRFRAWGYFRVRILPRLLSPFKQFGRSRNRTE